MSDGDFLDSNVLLYTFDEVDLRKRTIAERIVQDALDYDTAVISFQVVQEVLSVATRRIDFAGDVRLLLDAVLMPLCHVMPTATLYALGLDLYNRYRYSFYDSLIVAAALSSGCTRLYTEDLQAGQRIEKLTIIDPFA